MQENCNKYYKQVYFAKKGYKQVQTFARKKITFYPFEENDKALDSQGPLCNRAPVERGEVSKPCVSDTLGVDFEYLISEKSSCRKVTCFAL